MAEAMMVSMSEFVNTSLGLYFPRERWNDLERGVGAAAREFGFSDAQSCIEWLLSTRAQCGVVEKPVIEILASHLTVGETYFFRDRRLFHVLEHEILPDLIRKRRESDLRLRMWSAGCSTGEEAYSLAILLKRLIPDLTDWRITILGTDINPKFLRKAFDGVYGKWSFRDAPAWIHDGNFIHRSDGSFEVTDELKKMVLFGYLNLVDDVYPSLLSNTTAMDVIFCRNVVMYFSAGQAQRVTHQLHQSLMNDGWLIVSPSEMSRDLDTRFRRVEYPGAIVYQKSAKGCSFDRLLPDTDAAPAEVLPPSFNVSVSEMEIPEPYVTDVLPVETDERETMLHLARTMANQGDLAEAIVLCDQAITADLLNPEAHFLRATILQEQSLIDAAILSLRRALYLDPDFLCAYFALGHLLRRQGNFTQSEKHFKTVLSLLDQIPSESIVPESDGITAGRMREITLATLRQERTHDPTAA